ncbi:two-component sensor histidine kinase [Nonomuraea sp. KC401]|uniref:histidine kinase n=1 Tax=Nonomuraea longispora TaxID=1848320 RepID=A0A4R4NJF2_9ACTN|nr:MULTISPECIES: histidine kinase [Nonomuraea]NBE98429.1 two-component sensor histidine kinase [Nonomuraea sp. K271]TDC08764.1 two-component sensor histidine kinase [Nonomuraea longispora]TLF60982.1 two-component sensor histidine kinase [Nonomuraea sp. KC401]
MIHLRRIAELWRRCDVTLRDAPLALLLLVGSLLPEFQGHGTQIGILPTRDYDVLAVLVVALECLPLTVRRRWPGVCIVLVSLGFSLDQLLGVHAMAGTALPIALVSVGAHLERHRRATAVLLTVAFVPLMVALDRLGSGEPLADIVLLYVVLVLAWCIGAWLRSARAAEAERRRHVAAATRAAERTRIARELHDVVTHHVTAMVVQAEAARYLTAAPERLDATLSAVTDTGRRAITDLRHLLDLLNPDHDTDGRTPSAGDLHGLVEQTRQAGQPVEFDEEGTPPESAGSAEFVAYRVVQEALTNALKYAHGSRTEVRVRHAHKEISVEISTDGSGSRTRSPGGSGRGLAGLRDRVDALGGEFDAGPRPDGGFLVRARVPAGGPS